MLRPTLPVLSKVKPSSAAWLARQYRDPYVKKRLSDPREYRSRSAFKLLEIDDHWQGFLSKPDVKAVVDLGAAPGGWSQVVAGKLGWDEEQAEIKLNYRPNEGWLTPAPKGRARKNDNLSAYDPLNIDDIPDTPQGTGRGTVIAVDLLRIQPIRGVHSLQADFLAPDTEELIQSLLSMDDNPEGKVDVVLSDMAANTSGNHTADIEASLEICHAVLDFSKRHLRTAKEIGRTRGGVLLMKHFQDPLLQTFRMTQLRPLFNDVKFIKPESSRSESKEGYFLCQGWRGLS
ncbi:hypothetical protein H0H92_002610 [Tricholoma furcatifolium]|nr:hypothetical protein H0H92_002610 [Tricholoma furcatifolium]